MKLFLHRINLQVLDLIVLERTQKLIMTIEDNIREEKLPHDINRKQ